MINTDVVVVGGGMVGAFTAAALASCGVDVILLERAEPPPFNDQQYDLRVSALSPATEKMFQAVGAWDAVSQMRSCPYRRMLVWDSKSDSKTQFNSSGIGHDHLGHIVENRVIQLALWQQLERSEAAHVYCPATVDSIVIKDDSVIVRSADQEYCAALVIAADGANSAVREMAGIGVIGESYDQHALVATVTTELPQQDITWQRFTPNGPQAFLPLAGNRASMVWYESIDKIAELKQLTEQQFLQEMQSAFPDRLGGLVALQGIGSFPLHWQHAETYVAQRVALVGDAAHSVHPLAGQGVNMGMLDAAVLVECVMERFAAGRDIGHVKTLRRYERWRKPDNALLIKLLDSIQRVFQPETGQPVWSALRGLALDAANDIGPLNKHCMKVAMGLTGDLPQLARGRLPTQYASQNS